MISLYPLLCASLALAQLPAPLTQLLEAARTNNQTLAISREQLAEQAASVDQALSALTPTLHASGSYTRNQYAAVVSFPSSLLGIGSPGGTTTVTLQPYNAASASIGLNVPLFAAANLFRYSEAHRARDAAESGARASEAEVLLSTGRTYYQVVGAQGVVEAAQKALATADDSLRVAKVKFAAGTQNRVSVDRAQVDVARAQQTLVSSKQTLALALRSLETLTGETITQPFPAPLSPTLPSQSEADFVARAERERPEVHQAQAAVEQQELAVKEAWGGLAPTLTGNAQENFTNVTGFVNEAAFWTAGLSLGWTVDPVGTPAAVRHARAQLAEQRHRLKQAQDTVRDDVHTAWLAIDADAALVQQASSEAISARDGLAVTQQQFAAGTATSLDLSQAQRDAFNAEATTAQAQAELAGALLALRKAAGEPLLTIAEGHTP